MASFCQLSLAVWFVMLGGSHLLLYIITFKYDKLLAPVCWAGGLTVSYLQTLDRQQSYWINICDCLITYFKISLINNSLLTFSCYEVPFNMQSLLLWYISLVVCINVVQYYVSLLYGTFDSLGCYKKFIFFGVLLPVTTRK